jgi:O-methyltransferase domain
MFQSSCLAGAGGCECCASRPSRAEASPALLTCPRHVGRNRFAYPTRAWQADPSRVGVTDFSPFHQIVDVGGGQGVLLKTILSRYPQAHGVLFELASVIERARPSIEAAGLVERCELVAGDFFVSVPQGADAYILACLQPFSSSMASP